MSTLRRIAMRITSLTNLTLQRLLSRTGLWLGVAKIVKVRGPIIASKAQLKAKSFRPNAIRQIGRMIVKQRGVPIRAFSLGVWERAGALNYRPTHLHFIRRQKHSHSALSIAIRNYSESDVLKAVKATLPPSPVHTDLLSTTFPRYLDAYDLGSCIAVGCGGAIYEANFKTEPTNLKKVKHGESKHKASNYPFVIKMLFNYDMFASTSNLWRFNEPEIVPVIDVDVRGRMRLCRPFTDIHANVAPVCTAFIDAMPILPEARDLYPEALPDLSDVGPYVSSHNVLFLVMKRYSMPLHVYLNTETTKSIIESMNVEPGKQEHSNKIIMRKRSAMVAQLLEAINFLQLQKVAHRDLKSDNILVELDNSDETPHVLITDFGCCLAPRHNKHDMIMHSQYNDDLGGNVSLRPPEIRLAEPRKRVDFSKADLWASATIAIEIYTGLNPFYFRDAPFDSSNYTLADLPMLPDLVPASMRTLIKQILSRDPVQRPQTALAATTSALALTRTFEPCAALENIRRSLLSDIDRKFESMADLIALYAAETIIGARFMLSKAEVSLRRLFLARTNAEEINEAIHRYFLID